jgi:RNA polymerase sigma factor (sigma-70 family)
MTREDEIQAFKDLAANKEGARNRIIQSNLRFVVKIALAYKDRGVPLSDLIQEGNLGLLDVIDRYDVTLGYRFSTYAAIWIKQAIIQAIRRKSSVINLPVRQARKIQKLNSFAEEYKLLFGNNPDEQAIADSCNLCLEEVPRLIQSTERVSSLDATPEDTDFNLMHQIEEVREDIRDVILISETRKHIETAMEVLDAREQEILTLRYGLEDGVERSLRQVSKIVGLSQEGVRRIERRALDKMRRMETTEPLTECA